MIYRSPLKHNKLLKEANNLNDRLPFYLRYDIDKKMGLDVPDDDGEYVEWTDIDIEEDY